ncbi:MAG: hypothetical protein FWH37_09615 [Candidatus Bathyarchaeota archaeon]|nr:hypothetical protein [Candidatus Termiticorpusculum sp.]
MHKVFAVMLISLFVLSSFIGVFSSVLASETFEDSWHTKTPMNQARTNLGVVAVDGKIYAIGGSTVDDFAVDSTLGRYVGTNEQYDPKTDKWTTLASMPTPRAGFAITAYGDKIYCMGGDTYDSDAPVGEKYRHSNVVEVYDVATDSWSTKSFSSFVAGGQAHVINEKIFVIVGNALHMYDPVTDVWTRKTDAPLYLFQLASVVVDGKIILTGNIIIEMKPTKLALKTIMYDPQTDVWSEGKTETELLSDTCVAGVTTRDYAPQSVYFFSGISNNLVYVPTTDTWTNAQAMPSHRLSFGMAVVDDVFYVIGGTLLGTDDKREIVAMNEQYVPIGYSDVLPSDTKVPLITIGVVVGVVLSFGIVVGLFFYLNKRKER